LTGGSHGEIGHADCRRRRRRRRDCGNRGLCRLAVATGLGPGVRRPAPSTVSAGGTTLRSVSVDFPDPGNLFPGDKAADAINNNCLACHSAGMVLTQPHLSSADWQAEIDKMRDVYNAPIAETDVPAIVDYLVKLNTTK
jgi:hypothetical protein